MLVTFHSDAYENITYFGDVAKQLLKLMGHSGTIPGAILANDLPEALGQLQQKLAKAKNPSSEQDDDSDSAIALATRAIPLVKMLQASIRNDCDILWDV